jgi:protein-tyrosine phosphatase
MAEAFFNLAIKGYPRLSRCFHASSAGVMAINGDTASLESIQTLKKDWGIDISYHLSKLIGCKDIKEAYLVLTMTRKHKDALIRLFPNLESKIYTLKEYAEGNNIKNYFSKDITNNYDFSLDILDPYGMPLQVYKQCASEIKNAIDKVTERLALNENKS